MSENDDGLDSDQRRAIEFLDYMPKPGILAWFVQHEIGRTALKQLGRRLNDLTLGQAAQADRDRCRRTGDDSEHI